MALAPLLNAPFVVQLHVAATISSLILGGFQLSIMKRGARHRIMGRIWVTLMAIAAISSFFIEHKIKILFGYSPIHLLSIFTLINLFLAVYWVRTGKIRAHKITMIGLYWLGLVLTGLFTFIPPRIMGQLFYG